MSNGARTVRGRLAAVVVAATTLAACGTSATASTSREVTDGSPSATDASTAKAAAATIVGRWMQVHTCDQLVGALEDAGLGAIAPSQVGDYFPNMTTQELAEKDDICSGARPQRHFHFFTADDVFGSLDQSEQQVDDGTWTAQGDVLRIGDGAWRFEIDGTKLSLEPMITQDQIDDALARPLEWTPAGWIVAVAYPGTTWQRVPCRSWC